jgi:hypothetical protein
MLFCNKKTLLTTTSSSISYEQEEDFAKKIAVSGFDSLLQDD